MISVIYPNEKFLRKLAEENKIDVSGKTMEELCEMKSVKEALLKKIALKAKEMKFNSIEVPKGVHLIPKSFADYDCQTTSFKLKRHEAKKVFLPHLNKLYGK